MEENTFPRRRFQTFSIFSDFLWEGLRQVKKQHFKVKLLDLGSFNSLEQHAMCKHFFLLQKSLHPILCSRAILYFFLTVYLVVYGGGIYQIFIWSWCSCQFNFLSPPSPTAILFLFKIYIGKIFIPMFSYPPHAMHLYKLFFSCTQHNQMFYSEKHFTFFWCIFTKI